MTSTAPALTGEDRRMIAKAREVAAVRHAGLRKYAGEDDLGMACAVAFGRAQWEICNLLAIIERLAGAQVTETHASLPGHECGGACAEFGG